MAKGLGRGFDAILGSLDEDVPVQSGARVAEGGARPLEGLIQLPLTELKANPDQPRKEFAEEALDELAASIRERGIIQPLLVEPDPQGSGYIIIAGERRYRAAQRAGLGSVPALVRQVSEEERLEIALIENIQRADLTPLEEARAYRHLMETVGLTQEEVAQKVGKQRSTVANALRLLKLPSEMQSALEENRMTPGHARAILQVVNPAGQKALYGRIVNAGLSVREAEQQAQALNSGEKKAGGESPVSPGVKVDPQLLEVEQKLMEALGTRVEIRGQLEKGKLEITFYSADDLARLYELFAPGRRLFEA